ncbi:bile acid:sodium symporter family protein [Cellulosimicrobium funkei]|nr:bile acid:sodium symporter family protein [Cellulosimicrobium funkei]
MAPSQKNRARAFTIAAYIVFGLGFLVPFAASGWQGMQLSQAPGAVAAGLLLWAFGIVLEWRVYVRSHDSGGPMWRRVCDFIGRNASVWLLLGIAFGFAYHPTISTTVFGTNFSAILAITLAVMGVQITLEAWRQLIRDIRPVLLVVLLRWVFMPLIGYCVSFIAFYPFLPEEIANQLAIGMILLATSPTGAASNSLTLISKGDLALSVSATTVSVLIAPFLQPFLVQLFVGSSTSVDAQSMFMDLVQYVLAPVVIASIVGILVPRLVERVKPFLQPIAVLSLACVLMGTISKGTTTILENLAVVGFVLIACVVHGLVGLTLGYVAPRFFKLSHPQRVAASYEVGIENAAIAPALAISYFGPLALLPAVVYGKTQNIMAASIFAPYFLRKAEKLNAAYPNTPQSTQAGELATTGNGGLDRVERPS